MLVTIPVAVAGQAVGRKVDITMRVCGRAHVLQQMGSKPQQIVGLPGVVLVAVLVDSFVKQ